MTGPILANANGSCEPLLSEVQVISTSTSGESLCSGYLRWMSKNEAHGHGGCHPPPIPGLFWHAAFGPWAGSGLGRQRVYQLSVFLYTLNIRTR